MAKNNKLKRSAQLFSKEYGLPYLASLRAVDEPLHGLRDYLSVGSALKSPISRGHFQVVGSKSIYARGFEVPFHPAGGRDYRGFIKEQDLTHYSTDGDFFRDLARRVSLLERYGAKDIWHYRTLRRAGMLPESADELEPFFDHYGFHSSRLEGSLWEETMRVGIYGVSLSSYLESAPGSTLLPLEISQHELLIAGKNPDGALSRFLEHYNSQRELLEDRGSTYSHLATSQSDTAFYSGSKIPRLLVMFREGEAANGKSPEERLESLGLNPNSFRTERFSKNEKAETVLVGGVATLRVNGAVVRQGDPLGLLIA